MFKLFNQMEVGHQLRCGVNFLDGWWFLGAREAKQRGAGALIPSFHQLTLRGVGEASSNDCRTIFYGSNPR